MATRVYTEKEIEAMCLQSYMRGMSIQHDTMKGKKFIPKPFTEWVKDLIKNCPIIK